MFWHLILCLIQVWQSGAPMGTPRYGFGVGVVNNKIYVIGGRNETNILDVVEVYDPATSSWDTLAPLPTPRCFVGCAVYNSKIYVIGGMDYLFGPYNNTSLVERFDPIANQWQTVASMPNAKDALGACTYQGAIYAIGGYQWGFDSLGHYMRTVDCYLADSNFWYAVDSLNTPRINLGAAVYDNRIYVLGGSYFGSLSSVEYYVSNHWYTGVSMPCARSGLGVATYGDSLYTIAGEDSIFLNSVDIFIQDSVPMWINGPPLSQPRAHFGVAVVSDTVYVIGGKGPGGLLNTMEYHKLPIPGINETSTGELNPQYLFPTIVRKGTRFDFSEGDEIKIYSSVGTLLARGKSSIKLDLPQGVYFIRIQSKGSTPVTRKIVVIR